MNKEERKLYMREYRKNNKEKIQEQNKKSLKKFYETHGQEYRKHYSENNKEKIKEQSRKFRESPHGIKKRRIDQWKHYGLICDDYDALHDKYLKTTHCELCNVEFSLDKKRSKTTKCMDHCHVSGLFRNFICNSCNSSLPRQ